MKTALTIQEIDDFNLRWQKARLSAMEQVFGTVESEDLAMARLARAPSLLVNMLMRQIFDHSRLLGKSMASYFGRKFDTGEIAGLLQRSPSPCLSGSWSSDDQQSFHLKRDGCLLPAHRHVCDYWREAIDGLVMGLGDDARFSRFRSLGHGDRFCEDKYYSSDMPNQFGLVPGQIADRLNAKIAEWEKVGIKVHVQGFSESTLYYVVESVKSMACQHGAKNDQLVAQGLAELLPSIGLANISPKAVIAADLSEHT